MAYEKTVWVNGQAPALDAEHLNKIEQGIADAVSITPQTLTNEQKAQARGNISAMQGIESTDHPGCYYVLNGSAVEWVNPPMVTESEYEGYRTTERYKGEPVFKGRLGDFEVWQYGSGIDNTKWQSTGKSVQYRIAAGATQNIALPLNSTFVVSCCDNARRGVAIVQVEGQIVRSITPIVELASWALEAGSGTTVNIIEKDTRFDMTVSIKML